MAFDPSPASFGEFVLGDGGEKARGGPSLLIRLFGNLGPRPRRLRLRPQGSGGMKTTAVDNARLSLLLNELRLPAIKLVW